MSNGGEREIKGIWIDGKSFLENHYEELELSHSGNYMEVTGRVDEREMFTEPVFIPAATIDQALKDGEWRAGHLDHVIFRPSVEEFPDRWKGLVSPRQV